MKLTSIDTSGNKGSEITLKKEVFEITPNSEALGLYLRAYQSNARQGTSSTKTRGEVAGSGIKPWRQKGTGRARVGDKRNPIWRHGGISHGPKPKDWTLTVQKNIKNLALFSALSLKAKSKNLVILEDLKLKNNKTSEALEILSNIKAIKGLLILNEATKQIAKAFANIKGINIQVADKLNAFDVVNNGIIIFTKDSLKSFLERVK